MADEYPTTRADLLARVQDSRAELDSFIGGLSAEQLGAPGPAGGWSVKDHLYHLAVWERKALAQMRGLSIPAALGIDPAVWDRDDIDEINAAIQAQSRDLPLPEALAFCQKAHHDLLIELDRYPESEYGKPGYPAADDAQDPDGGTNRPMIAYIAGNTYEHYPEHLGYIRTSLQAD